MELKDYFRLRAAVIKAAQGRKDRLDSGEADASWETRLQDEWNIQFIERLTKLEGVLELLAGPEPELVPEPKQAE